MSDGGKALDHFQTKEDFQLLIDTAKQHVHGSKEEDFLAGLEDKLKTYGLRMFLSENQVRWLTDIATRS